MVVLAAACFTVGGAGPTSAGTNIYFRNDAPPEPHFVVDLGGRTAQVVVPGTKVRYINTDQYDVYRYGKYYYTYNDGFWYRGTSLDRKLRFVEPQFVPRPVRTVPSRYRAHWQEQPVAARWMPPGQMKKRHHKHAVTKANVEKY